MDALANLTVAETRNALEAMIGHAAIQHAGPWRVHSDWTEEVVSANGKVVAKCYSTRTATLLADALNKAAR